jgi:hypothetical protein
MYESLKNRIAALEEEEVIEEEEERRFCEHAFAFFSCFLSPFVFSFLGTYIKACFVSSAEEAQSSVKGMEENAIHAKYIELVSLSYLKSQDLAELHCALTQFAELKRVERDHAKEKQKLVKDKDAGPLIIFLFLSSYYQIADTSLSFANTKRRAS